MHVPLTLVATFSESRAKPVVASPSDHHTVTVEVAPDFHLRFPNIALQQDRFLRFVNLRKSEIYERNQ